MSEIPSDIASSAAGTGYQAQQAGGARAANRAAQTGAVDRQVKALNDQDVTVETTDGDAQVFADSEGGGSQGRSLEEDGDASDDDSTEASKGGVTEDDDGQLHVDLEA